MTNLNYEVHRKAFKEFYEIAKYFSKEEYSKISKKFLNVIEENMDKDYEYKVEHIDDFQNQQMLRETRVLLAIVYKYYLSSKFEKTKIIEKENKEKNNQTKENNYNEIFKTINEKALIKDEKIKLKNKEQFSEKENDFELPIILEKEKWYTYFIRKIKSLCKKR